MLLSDDTKLCIGFGVNGIHESKNPKNAVETAEAIFIGGGNTFQLLKSLYDNDVIGIIRKRVLRDGVPYIGSSAGNFLILTQVIIIIPGVNKFSKKYIPS